MSNNLNSQSSFEKDLLKIGRKDSQASDQIFVDLAQLEQVGQGIRDQTVKSTLNTKLFSDGTWQLTSGDYRVWYQFDENGEIEYLKVFKKQKNATPKRHRKSLKGQHLKPVAAKKLKVNIKEKAEEVKKKREGRKKEKKKKKKKNRDK